MGALHGRVPLEVRYDYRLLIDTVFEEESEVLLVLLIDATVDCMIDGYLGGGKEVGCVTIRNICPPPTLTIRFSCTPDAPGFGSFSLCPLPNVLEALSVCATEDDITN